MLALFSGFVGVISDNGAVMEEIIAVIFTVNKSIAFVLEVRLNSSLHESSNLPSFRSYRITYRELLYHEGWRLHYFSLKIPEKPPIADVFWKNNFSLGQKDMRWTSIFMAKAMRKNDRRKKMKTVKTGAKENVKAEEAPKLSPI